MGRKKTNKKNKSGTTPSNINTPKNNNKNEKQKRDKTLAGHSGTLNVKSKEDNKNERNRNNKMSPDAHAKSESNVEIDISNNIHGNTSTHVREMKNVNTGKCNNPNLDKNHSKNAVNKNPDKFDTSKKGEQNLMVHKVNACDTKDNDFDKEGHDMEAGDCNEKKASVEKSEDVNPIDKNSDQLDSNEEKDLQSEEKSKKEIKNSFHEENLETDIYNRRYDNAKSKANQDKGTVKETQKYNDANTSSTSKTKLNNQNFKNVKGSKDGNTNVRHWSNNSKDDDWNRESVKKNLERENSSSRDISHAKVQSYVKNENESKKVNSVQSGSSKRNHYYKSNSLERPSKKGEEYDYFKKKHFNDGEMDFHIINEVDGDLFCVGNDYSLAHCVAEDMAMGSGIAVTFRQMFKRVDELLNQRQDQGGLAVLQDKQRYIYYLVTKRISSGKPTYYTLWSSLQKMKHHIMSYDVTKLALPRIGCGLDGLEWKFVKKMLEYIFQDVDVEIKIHNFQQNPDASSPSQLRKCHVENVSYPIKDIERSTIIIYFGSEDGYETEELRIICEKFPYIRSNYKSGDRQVGKYIYTNRESEQYVFYGCIVRQNHTDRFDFTYFQKCLNCIQVENRKRKYSYEYIAFQAFIENEDELIVSKIVNLMRYSMTGVHVYVCWPENLEKYKPKY